MRTFSYNELNQLLSAANPEQQFSHDEDGNMTQGYTPEGFAFTAKYDGENRLHTIEYTDAGGINLYAFVQNDPAEQSGPALH